MSIDDHLDHRLPAGHESLPDPHERGDRYRRSRGSHAYESHRPLLVGLGYPRAGQIEMASLHTAFGFALLSAVTFVIGVWLSDWFVLSAAIGSAATAAWFATADDRPRSRS